MGDAGSGEPGVLAGGAVSDRAVPPGMQPSMATPLSTLSIINPKEWNLVYSWCQAKKSQRLVRTGLAAGSLRPCRPHQPAAAMSKEVGGQSSGTRKSSDAF